MTPAIEVRNLTKRFGATTAIDDITLSFEEGIITGLLGRNGAGKTVLMSLITAQERPTSGSVRLLGSDPNHHERQLANVLFVRDTQRYPSEYKVRDLMRIAPVFHPGWDQELAEEVVRRFELPTRRQLRRLSRGQQSAVAVMLGLASRAPVTIFDEPYLGMDATARAIFYDMLLADYAQHPRTVIISTHLIDEMEQLLERIVVLDHGRVLHDASAEDLRSLGRRISGTRPEVERVLAGSRPLRQTWLGGTGSVIVQDPGLIQRAVEAGLRVEPVGLQELVAAYGFNEDEGSGS